MAHESGKTYKTFLKEISALRKSRPDIKDPVAYVQTVEKTIQARREAKQKKK